MYMYRIGDRPGKRTISSAVWVLGLAILLIPLAPSGDFACAEPPAETGTETMLMFLGEDLEVLSIASRREESARQAPAVARVVGREEIRNRGVDTLAGALSLLPGFHPAKREWGYRPYLRGIPDSILLLHDTVPLGTDTTKSLTPFGLQLSLAPVKRIEIIRGPGSVLWGPDAFAGIVNIVPLSGEDVDGVETGVSGGLPDESRSFYINAGRYTGLWDLFLSVNGRAEAGGDDHINLVRFWGDGVTAVPPEARMGSETLDDARYLEASGHADYLDRFSLSFRLADNKIPYAVTRSEEDITWREVRRAPSGFVKVEAKQETGLTSALRFTGAWSFIRPEYEVIDRRLVVDEETFLAETLFDKTVNPGEGLFTGGLSFREKRVKDAVIWVYDLTDYLGPENEQLLPEVEREDYRTRLWSIFGQYTHTFGDIEAWLGLRGDLHDTYRDHLSYNAGVSWSPAEAWMIKLLYGTAYRTPYARQLLESETPELENIRCLQGEIYHAPAPYLDLRLVGFTGRIKDHILEDPYAGLSLPNHQDIYGVELEAAASPAAGVKINANLSLIENTGPQETYHYNDYDYINDEGEIEKHYTDLRYPYDSGPKSLFDLSAAWRITERTTLTGCLAYFSDTRLIYPKSDSFVTLSGAWTLDAAVRFNDLLFPDMEASVAVENLTDRRYEVPGAYSPIEGDPLTVSVTIRKRW